MTVDPLTVTVAAAESKVWVTLAPVQGVPEQILMSLPVTGVMFSLNVRTRFVEIATPVESSAGVVGVMVGAVVSRVIVVVAVAAEVGPSLPAVSVAPDDANCGVTVPEPQLDTVIVYGPAPDPADTANAHPVAVPVFEKSPDATPVTDSENVKEYVKDVAVVGLV